MQHTEEKMRKQNLFIDGIPAILWGEKSTNLFVAIHGNMSSKDDDPIAILAEETIVRGYQVLSFDLPQHGERKDDSTPCKVQNCVGELEAIMCYAQSIATDISVFACSMGAYFSLVAYQDKPFQQCLFLSPVVNMSRIIENIMTWFDVSKERLKNEKEITIPIGQTLYWDYYCYVQEHPIARWDVPTSILYGSEDNLCEFDMISSFSRTFDCDLQVMEQGEHYFHTPEQLKFLRNWLIEHLVVK